MKYFLFCCLLLAGCVHTDPVDMIPVPIRVARATDGNIEWRCQLTKLDKSLAGVECTFTNTSIYENEVCIRVSYYDELTNKLVVQSPQICSGSLKPNTFRVRAINFEKDNRKALQRCGELLDSCVMLAGSGE